MKNIVKIQADSFRGFYLIKRENKDMMKTEYHIEKMDCPSEEQLIRMKLEEIEGIQTLNFDIPNRRLSVSHICETELLSAKLAELNFGSTILDSVVSENDDDIPASDANDRKLLWAVLVINFAFFIIEMTTGIISESMGLIADSLDMFADASVYGLSLLAVGKTISRKKMVAKLSGYFQMILAVFGFFEVMRRVWGFDRVPVFEAMIIVSLLALIANTVSLIILNRSKNKEAHIRASMIFTSNDIIINIGVIFAGVLVNIMGSNIPDLLIGAFVFAIVIRGAYRILALAK